uniref:Uncharacterized protein n=1 Tax=Arundo donax TaxID=35708 RepID=A0A0A8XXL3_ARUDO
MIKNIILYFRHSYSFPIFSISTFQIILSHDSSYFQYSVFHPPSYPMSAFFLFLCFSNLTFQRAHNV